MHDHPPGPTETRAERARKLGNQGAALNNQCRFDDAEQVLLEAVSLDPRAWGAWSNLGNTMVERQRFGDAIAAFSNALAVHPEHGPTLANMGVALTSMGQPASALQFFDLALQVDPENAESQCNKALALLAAGDWRNGFAAYEWRWRTRNKPPHAFPAPLWDGRRFEGRTLLLHDEGGFGDTLQFIRFAQEAKSRGGTVLLSVRQPLVRLLSRLDCLDQVIAMGDPLPPFDLQCPMFSLPGRCGVTIDTVPGADGYLAADPSRVRAWRDRLDADGEPGKGLRIGLVWAGGPHPYARESALADQRRSIALEMLTPLADALPDARFYSVQIGAAAAEATRAPPSMRLIDHTSAIGDFDDTAALLMGLDLLVSVDTSTAHLAAALGRPVCLLSRFDQCWRWLTDRDDTPWYTRMQLYRQPAPFDWQTPIARLAQDLRACRIPQAARVG